MSPCSYYLSSDGQASNQFLVVQAPRAAGCSRPGSTAPRSPTGEGQAGPRVPSDDMEKVTRTEAEWRELLSPDEYRVLRQAGTEAPFIGEYTDTKTVGVYKCRACGAELFRSDT